ncbi:MAG: ATP synthase F1 subunit epsilon [Pirellulaceae bacterium]|nr:ATP synthase F1 subunit epsilon [Pirellulaceae bacterium]
MSELQCVIVTPEKTEVDVRATSVTVPLYDGELGILKGHSPLVGRLGYGVLRIHGAAATEQYFVEEGLVQVSNNVVSILTERVTPVSQINSQMAAAANDAAITMPQDQPDQVTARRRAMQRARALQRVTGATR